MVILNENTHSDIISIVVCQKQNYPKQSVSNCVNESHHYLNIP